MGKAKQAVQHHEPTAVTFAKAENQKFTTKECCVIGVDGLPGDKCHLHIADGCTVEVIESHDAVCAKLGWCCPEGK